MWLPCNIPPRSRLHSHIPMFITCGKYYEYNFEEYILNKYMVMASSISLTEEVDKCPNFFGVQKLNQNWQSYQICKLYIFTYVVKWMISLSIFLLRFLIDWSLMA